MFDGDQITWIVGLQGVIQSLVMSVLWIIVFVRLRYGALGICVALLPFLGIFAVVATTLFVGRLPLDDVNIVVVYSVIPNLVGFLFAIAPLVFLVVRLNTDRHTSVFE